MRRRFQFSLRALLVALAAICGALGTWTLVVAKQEGLAASHATAGRSFVLRARFVRLLLPRPLSCNFFVSAHHDVNVSSTVVWMGTADVTRNWLVFYSADFEMTLRGGMYNASASLDGESVSSTKCTILVERGK